MKKINNNTAAMLAMMMALGITFSNGNAFAGASAMSQNSRSENTRSDNTRSENTRSENSRSENTKSENTKPEKVKPEIKIKADMERVHFEPMEIEIEVSGGRADDTETLLEIFNEGKCIKKVSGGFPFREKMLVGKSGDYIINVKLSNGEESTDTLKVRNVFVNAGSELVRKVDIDRSAKVIKMKSVNKTERSDEPGAWLQISGKGTEHRDEGSEILKISGRYGETITGEREKEIRYEEGTPDENVLVFEEDEEGEKAVKELYERAREIDEKRERERKEREEKAAKNAEGRKHSAVVTAVITALILGALILDAKRRL